MVERKPPGCSTPAGRGYVKIEKKLGESALSDGGLGTRGT